jgi:hypothetical protein
MSIHAQLLHQHRVLFVPACANISQQQVCRYTAYACTVSKLYALLQQLHHCHNIIVILTAAASMQLTRETSSLLLPAPHLHFSDTES